MPIDATSISGTEVKRVLRLAEGHFCDLKSLDILPAKLTQSISAFANADGGELYVGIDENKSTGIRTWRGFGQPEDANAHIAVFERLFPLSSQYAYDFLASPGESGLILRAQVMKSRAIVKTSDGEVYIRRGAQNLHITKPEALESLKRDKGLASFETETVDCPVATIAESDTIRDFMANVVPTSQPEPWLRKQMLVVGKKPTVAGLVLFADEPQAVLPRQSGIKICRYKTTEPLGTRETLDFDPVSIEGNAYEQIASAVAKTAEVVESMRVMSRHGLETVRYPVLAVHEIVTNAVLHRDYSIKDDIQILIFDNRVEVRSPGTLPGHVTSANILQERFARNGTIVRIINKFPNPPNKDIGEGLNTAFQAMRQMKLREPVVQEVDGYVVVTLRHEKLATPQELVLEYLKNHPDICNRDARDICHIGSENKMKTVLQGMVRMGLVELVPGRTRYTAAYRLPSTEDKQLSLALVAREKRRTAAK
jgi:ATP-dependent DNA helicase RecG